MRAATSGRRVLVTSTDPAHSLADVLDQPLGDAPTPVAPRSGREDVAPRAGREDVAPRAGREDAALTGWPASGGCLDGQQIDAQDRLERHWHEVRDYLVALLARGGVDRVRAEELVLLPGLDELFALIDLRHRVAGGDYDLVVVDCAPTAETLRLLALPDALRFYVDRLVGPGRRVARGLRGISRAAGSPGVGLGAAEGLPLPDDAVFGAVERVHEDLAAVHELLQDPARSSLRLVVNPERLVLAESRRSATSLSLFGYAIDAVVVNRVLPDEVADPYLATWKQRHAEHLATVRSSFAPTPVLTAPMFDDELIGVAGLARLGVALYGETDESAVLHDVHPVTVVSDGEDQLLRVALPFATRDGLDLHRRGPDLHVEVDGVKRTVSLPQGLRRRDVAGASLRDGQLEVRFRAAPETAVAIGEIGA